MEKNGMFANWGVKRKLVVTYFLIALLPVSILGFITYNKTHDALFYKIREELQKSVEEYRSSIERDLSFAKADTKEGKLLAKQLVANQAKSLIEFLHNRDKSLPLEKLKDSIARIKIGKTGYVFVVDYQGHYVVSQNRKEDGRNIMNVVDDNGTSFIREIIQKGRRLSAEGVDYHTYFWKNKGEKRSREKISAIIHMPKQRWIIGLSAYYNDLVNDQLSQQVIERFKHRLKAEKVGKTGYMFVMNSDGDVYFHPTSEGKNLSQHSFVKTMMENKAGVFEYEWEGRDKIVAYTHYIDKDWIIGSGSYVSDFSKPIVDIRNITLAVLIISIILALLFAFFLSSSIVNPILKIIGGVRDSSEQVSDASVELSNASQSLSSSAGEQAASLEETSSSLEEISGMVNNNVDKAKKCTELSSAVNSSSQSGNESMKQLAESMQEILKSNEEIAQLVKVIGEVGEKTKVIDEIVFQTKLLSFNASVEAERAGEHGRGFAVVAQEVGNLAEMSGKAATEISTIISSSIKNAESIASANKEKVESGDELARHAATVLEDISRDANIVLESIDGILSASEDQASGIGQINVAVSQLNKVTQENASTSEEAASSSEELSAQAENLNDMVHKLTKLIIGDSADVESTKRVGRPLKVNTPQKTPAVKKGSDASSISTIQGKDVSPWDSV